MRPIRRGKSAVVKEMDSPQIASLIPTTVMVPFMIWLLELERLFGKGGYHFVHRHWPNLQTDF